MIRVKQCTLAAVLALGTLQASADPDDQRGNGQISYVNPASLEIGINDRLYRLDSGFVIHGFGNTDRAQQVNALRPGMYIDFVTSGPAGSGMITEIRIRVD